MKNRKYIKILCIINIGNQNTKQRNIIINNNLLNRLELIQNKKIIINYIIALYNKLKKFS